MIKTVKSAIVKTVRRMGYDIQPYRRNQALGFPLDFSPEEIDLITEVRPCTMVGKENLQALIHAVRHVEAFGIEGDIVECGVWKGGCMMAVAKTLASVGSESRALYLYDTFEGMTEPTETDVSWSGEKAVSSFELNKTGDNTADWARAGLDQVKESVLSTGYAPEKIHFVKGPVEETLPGEIPEKIAVLRLDTDWYESTKHELVHLYPRLASGGVLIIDDYGFWEGARKAVDEYLSEEKIGAFLHRIDETARLLIKP